MSNFTIINSYPINKTIYYTISYDKNSYIETSLGNLIANSYIFNQLKSTQACLIGMDFANSGETIPFPIDENKENVNSKKYKNQLLCETREKKLVFEQIETKNIVFICPLELMLAEELLNEFPPYQAFHIGLLAGLQIKNKRNKYQKSVFHLSKNKSTSC